MERVDFSATESYCSRGGGGGRGSDSEYIKLRYPFNRFSALVSRGRSLHLLDMKDDESLHGTLGTTATRRINLPKVAAARLMIHLISIEISLQLP